MKIACVVLNWNGWLDTIECLESVLRSTHREYRVVVCDNGSQDGSFDRLLEWAEGLLEISPSARETQAGWRYRPVPKPIPHVAFASIDQAFSAQPGDERVTFIQNQSNLGYAGGNNVGIRFALERLDVSAVWILNNDTAVDRLAMSAQTDFLEQNPRTAITGARLLKYYKPGRIQALGGGTFSPSTARDTQIGRGSRSHPLIDVPIELDHVVGASMLVRTEAIRSVGLLDESYFLYREETDWCIRMREHGWRLNYCPSALVWHKEGQTRGFKTMLYDYYAVRNMLFVISRFYPKSMPFAFVVSLARVLLPKLARMQLRRIYLSCKAFIHFTQNVRGKNEIDPDAIILQRLLPQDPGYGRAEVSPPTA